MKQKLVWCKEDFLPVRAEIAEKKCLVVCGKAYASSPLKRIVESCCVPVYFKGYSPNPKYEEILAGIALFRSSACECILAVGGGSAMDTAKGIKLGAYGDPEKALFGGEVPKESLSIPLIAVPTTAGTGSESTRYAVFYRDGEKVSATHEGCIPDVAVLCSAFLKRLPMRQRIATYLDAYCQAIESAWSVRATEQSKTLAFSAIDLLTEHGEAYLAGSQGEETLNSVMQGSSLAGQAIDLTSTTAAHAMCYQLTVLYGIPHGMAVALCLPKIWRYMLAQSDWNDPRGEGYVRTTFDDIAKHMGASTVLAAVEAFETLLSRHGVVAPALTEERIAYMASKVDVSRLSRNPGRLTEKSLCEIYDTLR